METICNCAKGVSYFEMPKQELIAKYFLLETNEELPFAEAFKFNGKYYAPCCRRPKENIMIVREFEPIKDIDSLYAKPNIKCPYCGTENSDSWEREASGDAEICETCGSEFTWEREVETTYTMEPVRQNPIKEINSTKD